MEAGPSASPNSSELRTGYRYLQAKNGQPLRLRYIGPLPPSSAEASQIWYGVEYDDPSRGKGHPGTFEGTAVFHTQQEGAGAFIKAGPKPIFEQGKTFLQAVADRYGALNPEVGAISSSSVDESILLGSSNSSIKVEAPNIQDVQKRVGRLEKLREMGLEGEWVNGVGGDEEMRRKVRERLGRLKTLNLSRNLLNTWKDVAEIVEYLPGLKVLVLKHSRIAPLPSALPPEITSRLKAAFANIMELHLGNACITWQEVCHLAVYFHSLEELHLNANSLLRNLRRDSTRGRHHLAKLKILSLEGCGLISWEEIAREMGALESLESLNLSSIPISSIPALPLSSISSPAVFTRLTHLVLLNTSLSHWSDIDAVESWTGGRLRNLRISRLEQEDTTTVKSDYTQMSNDLSADRPIYIAKLSGLQALNSTELTISERREAELFYLSHVAKLFSDHPEIKSSDWGRYEKLCRLHGRASEKKLEVRSSALRSKLITLHVYPAEDTPFDISVLPTSPITLLQRKIAKQLGARDFKAVQLWTARSVGQTREKVAEVLEEPGKDVGWWCGHEDDLSVELI